MYGHHASIFCQIAYVLWLCLDKDHCVTEGCFEKGLSIYYCILAKFPYQGVSAVVNVSVFVLLVRGLLVLL